MSARSAACLALAFALVGCGASDAEEAAAAPERTPASATRAEAPEARAESEPAADALPCPLEGLWRMTHYPGQDAVGPNGERPMPMSREYSFADGRFVMSGYPALEVRGRYRATASGERGAALEMSEVIFDGAPAADETHALAFTDACDGFDMDGWTFERAAER